MREPKYDNIDNDIGILIEDCTYQTSIYGYSVQTVYAKLTPTGRLTMYRPYRWDFGTGAVDTRAVRCASLIHDVLCQLIAEKVLPKKCRRQADKEYRKLLKAFGMHPVRILWQYYFIRFYVRVIKPWTG